MSEDRLQVIKMIEEGQVSADEAVELLDALNGKTPQLIESQTPREEMAQDMPQVGSWWLVPTGIGAGVFR